MRWVVIGVLGSLAAGCGGDLNPYQDPDNCTPNPCMNGGTCTDGIDSYACVCVEGLSGSNCELVSCDGVIPLPDPNLEAAIRYAIEKPSGDIMKTDLAILTEFFLGTSRNISNLTGIQCASNLTELDLQTNQISDLSPLAGLTGLRRLWLAHNQITDLSPLAGLKNLSTLKLDDNQIVDPIPLAGLDNLETLSLSINQIADLSSLVSGVPALVELFLLDNPIDCAAQAASIQALRSRLELVTDCP
jgi:hypothetical protein